jgi:hypothetical protein
VYELNFTEDGQQITTLSGNRLCFYRAAPAEAVPGTDGANLEKSF